MSFFLVKTRAWENSLLAESDLGLEKGDVVIMESENGTETGIIAEVSSQKKHVWKKQAEKELKNARILRKANLSDLNAIKEFQKKEKEALEICRREVKKAQLPMKIVNCAYSLDRGSITFVFIAEGRVDFRDLVKNLSRVFQRSIKLYQIGARDEARNQGGFGICGRELCCIRFKSDLPSISSEMAKAQQIIRRGSERISGICGRLMCCLAYEAGQYQELLEKMPGIGAEIKLKEGIGRVREVNVLTGEIKLELSDKSIVKTFLKDI